MTTAISVAEVSRRYHGQLALDHVGFDIEPGSITGLLGRNGAGKTTLMRIIAGQEFPSSGRVSILDASPTKGNDLLHRMVFIREDQRYPDYGWGARLFRFRVSHALALASWLYPQWSQALAESLLADFNLSPDGGVKYLSRGARSALGIVIGLAARAEVTLFDEPYAGLDPVARQLFYDRLLADYAECPRTILLSTHLIDEAAGLLERILVLDRGRITLDAATDDIRGAATSISGSAISVAEVIGDHTVLHRRSLAGQESVVIAGAIADVDRQRAARLRVRLEPLSLQQFIVQATTGQPDSAPQERTSA
jgi:ABC-2 type transport system ATP-binding protein